MCAFITYKNNVLLNYRVELNVCCSLHLSVHKETQISKNMFENKTKTSFLVQLGKLPIFC